MKMPSAWGNVEGINADCTVEILARLRVFCFETSDLTT